MAPIQVLTQEVVVFLRCLFVVTVHIAAFNFKMVENMNFEILPILNYIVMVLVNF